ncbi:MAG TPA: glycoside hydrolase family 2 TIM barrel-domain containing protein [Sporolactobacillaceae bacterium]|nr:glycoside hydrolase family 2 TIM barrel-domain containing protein [Sporolactobacillaceae bacterium]
MQLPKPEYPRPQFKRKSWVNLNGQWNFEFDDANTGLNEKWFKQPLFEKEIQVPFAFQTQLSGIHESAFHDVVWYQRAFSVPEEWSGQHVLLHFGAVDYRCQVWVNGEFVTAHEGGHTPFYADITWALEKGQNQLVVRVEDRSTDLEQPRGKQFWEPESKAIFYTRTTGIWQTVWLEPVPSSYIEKIKVTPDIDQGDVRVDYFIANRSEDQKIEIEISYSGNHLVTRVAEVGAIQFENFVRIGLPDFEAGEGKLWSPETPHLYDIQVRLIEKDHILDDVSSYFGMRKISIDEGEIRLNNRPYYMKLVLDQGYYPESLLTAPSEDAIKQDITLTKQMGFNGVRKHQKVEEPRYLYWADHLGLLVWGEMANAHTYTEQAVHRITSEWQEAIERDYNHPSIVAWVPLNESWGIPRLKRDMRQKNHALSLFYLTKSLDQTRLVISNDGWEHVRSDLLTIHDYTGEKETLKTRYAKTENALTYTPADRSLYVKGFSYKGEPIFVSEFGGIAFEKSDWKGWGYTAATSDDDFIERYYNVVSALLESPLVQGFCYTQITDVEQEINGLLTYDRQPKVDLELIRAINEGQSLNELIKKDSLKK